VFLAEGNTVRCSDAKNLKELWRNSTFGEPRQIMLSGDGREVRVLLTGGAVRRYDATTGKRLEGEKEADTPLVRTPSRKKSEKRPRDARSSLMERKRSRAPAGAERTDRRGGMPAGAAVQSGVGSGAPQDVAAVPSPGARPHGS